MAQWLSVMIEANASRMSYMTGDVLCILLYIHYSCKYIYSHNYRTSQIYSTNAINVPLKVEELDTEE